ncbi:c-type cytochrome [Phaeobacter marinintestinus]|uniref:c-type cytochrome n=1 Tax=Falsiphaeobacter marinintestinus TaxID=1492905 RepID=UPI0011B63B68|nr:cytochrome c [Phaeobacter marinintestinus]
MRPATYLCIVPIIAATAVFAHSGVKDPTVMARMQNMGTIGENMKVIGQMMKKEIPFDAVAAQVAAGNIAAAASLTVAKFEDPATDPKSEALPAIWEDFADFSTKASDLETVARTQAGTIGSYDDLRGAAGALAGACKACHSRYKAD